MKTYEKPKLIALSLSGNDRLCGDCADSSIKICTNPEAYKNVFGFIDRFYGDNDGSLERSDFVGLFAMGEASCTNKVPGEMYCKFTSGDSGKTTIAWS